MNALSQPTAMNQPLLQVNFLGGFELRVGNNSLGFSYDKVRALFAYLVMEPVAHSRESLAQLLWPTIAPKTARGNLRRCLFDLRSALAAAAPGQAHASTIRGIGALRFEATDCLLLDVREFLATHTSATDPLGFLARRAALYRGEFLAGLSMPECPEFDDWLVRQRETLHRRALDLLKQLSISYEQMGDHGKALQYASRLTELDPWDEEAHRQAMRLFALNGQHGAALGQYEACCRLLKNELGVLPSEETRQLVQRIRNGESQKDWPAPETSAPRPGIVPSLAQRRQVTVLFCELILAVMDDPDEAMALLHAPQARCVRIIEQFSGHIVQTHGGGLLAYFGYPRAHEDAARRAVQAALAVTREAVCGIEIRAGVHTGLVITGGDGVMPDTSGRTTRVAIALRHHTARYKVGISRETHSIVDGYFDCFSQGAQILPGVGQALEIFKVLAESGARTRLDAAAQLTPLVGRTTEIDALMGWWQGVTQGRRQVIVVHGDAGIGKSRLLHALKERLADQPHVECELRCFPEFSQSPFHPVIEMLEGVFGFAHGDLPEVRLEKLIAYLETHFAASAPSAVPLLGALLSLPLADHDPDYPELDCSAQKQKQLTHQILIEILHTLAARQPVLLIAEDLHWMDPSTRELLTQFVELQQPCAILVVLTARPEFDPPWHESLESTLALTPLAAHEVATMIASIRTDMEAATIRGIVERADGVPLFAEEMAKNASTNNPAAIPATLHDLLAARMDGLGEAKTTAQLAATLGREFDLALLGKIFPLEGNALTQSLNVLQEAGLIQKMSPQTCQFKHTLIQEAAYQSQAKPARQAAHQRIAHTLLSDFPEVVLTQPELLAQHFSFGGETLRSIDYWIKAGQRAALSSAHTEAMGHFNVGRQLLMTLPPSVERNQWEFALRVGLGATRIATQGYGSLDAGAEYTRAAELGASLGDGPSLFRAMWGMWLGESSRIGHAHALGLAEKLLQLAEKDQDPLLLQKAHYAMGNSLLWTGQLGEARRHQERGIALYQPAHHATMVRELGENICVSTGSQLAWVLWLQGFPDQAQAMGEKTLALALEVNHPYSRCYASAHLVSLHHWLRQIDATSQRARETLAQANQHGFPLWLLSGLAFQGWTQALRGDASGLAQLQSGVDTVRAAMGGIEAFFLALLADAYWHLGRRDSALEVVHQALAVMQAKDDHFLESEMLRLKGECLLVLDVPDAQAAEGCFVQALAISQQQGAKSLELRAATSLARLWHRQGKSDDARGLLEGVYAWFKQGLDVPDLEAARQLLAELATAQDTIGA